MGRLQKKYFWYLISQVLHLFRTKPLLNDFVHIFSLTIQLVWVVLIPSIFIYLGFSAALPKRAFFN
jgi:hypothetical protein